MLGATDSNDEWKLKGITVDYTPSPVPLPAAGWFLIAGIGGLAAAGRSTKNPLDRLNSRFHEYERGPKGSPFFNFRRLDDCVCN